MISFCTVCYNRTEHIKQTYKKNIETAKGNEFILVNYGGSPGLDEFVGTIEYDNFKYIKVDAEYNISKAKNVSHYAGKGDILFCLDADTYIMEQCMDNLNNEFKRGYYFCHPYADRTPLAIWRDDFYHVGGWNESIKDRGEDMDMAMRLKGMGLISHYPVDSSRTIKHINHD